MAKAKWKTKSPPLPKLELPFQVIGYYVPEKWSIKLVTSTLENLTELVGLEPLPLGKHRLHKGPYQNPAKHSDLMRRLPKYDSADLQWHRDGDMAGCDENHSIVLWCTKEPTQIKYKNEIYQPKPYEVVIVNNAACHHRRSPDCPRVRWFFRQRVVTPKWLEI